MDRKAIRGLRLLALQLNSKLIKDWGMGWTRRKCRISQASSRRTYPTVDCTIQFTQGNSTICVAAARDDSVKFVNWFRRIFASNDVSD